jgi:hypothetical protein
MLNVSVACALSQNVTNDFVKPFSVDSFVYSATPSKTNFAFRYFDSKSSHFRVKSFAAPGEAVETREPNGLECPVCNVGPPNRSRYSAPPFGAKATYTFWHSRIELFASFGGTEAWKQDGMLQGVGGQKLSNFGVNEGLAPKFGSLSAQWGGSHLLTNDQYNDQWLVQSHMGLRYFLDQEKNVSFGFTKGYMYNFSPLGSPDWTSSTGDLTITFGNGPAKLVGKGMRRLFRRGRGKSTDSPNGS